MNNTSTKINCGPIRVEPAPLTPCLRRLPAVVRQRGMQGELPQEEWENRTCYLGALAAYKALTGMSGWRLCRRTALVLAFLCLVSAGRAARDEEFTKPIFVHAEEMQLDDTAWSVQKHYYNWYRGRPWGTMLRGYNHHQGKATTEIEVPQAGEYHLWVRYLDIQTVRGPFSLSLHQEDQLCGEKVFDLQSIREKSGYGRFVWDSMTVNLAAGKALLTMDKRSLDGTADGKLSTVSHSRQVDTFVLSADPAYKPDVSDLYPPLWVKARMLDGQPAPSVIHLFGKNGGGGSSERGYYTGHRNLDRKGLTGSLGPRKGQTLAAGDVSAWADIASFMDYHGNNVIRFYAITNWPHTLEGASFELLFANQPDDDAIFKRIERTGSGSGVLVTINQEQRIIRDEVEWSHEALAAARDLAPPAGRRATRFSLATGLALSYESNVRETVDNEMEILTRLGFSGLQGIPNTDFFEHGFRCPRSGQFILVPSYLGKDRCFSRPNTNRLQQSLTSLAETLAALPPDVEVACIDFMDEPGSTPVSHLATCTNCIAGFQHYLRDRQGLEPDFFGHKHWETLTPATNRENAKLHYWTTRYRCQVFSDFLKRGTDILKVQLPDVRTTVNYNMSLSYGGNLLRNGVDWFLTQDEGLTYGWHEDWLNFGGTFQFCGYLVDFQRAAARKHDQGYGMYNILGGRKPWDIMAKSAAEIGHGVKALHYFNYGPSYSIATDANSHRHELYPALARVNHAIGAVEDYIVDGTIPPSRLAMLYSHSTDIWTADSVSLHGKERQNFWLLLRHLGLPVEIVTETEVASGALANFDALMLHGSHIDRAAAEALIPWVEAGGVLYLGAGSGLSDEYNASLDLRERLGLIRGDFTVTALPGQGSEFHSLKVIESVRVGTNSLEAVCGIHQLTPWQGAEVLAKFEEGRPALISGKVGQGRVIVSGFFPGIGYVRSGAQRRSERDANVTYNPPAFSEVYRTFFAKVLSATGWQAPVKSSHPLVEVNMINSPHGLLLVLSNWSGLPVDEVEISLTADATLGPPQAVVGTIIASEGQNGSQTIRLPVDAFEFIYMPRIVSEKRK